MRALWITVLFGAGCLNELPPEHDVIEKKGACSALEGLTFRSLQQGECGLTPNGPAFCTWSITFATEDAATVTRFSWRHSDVGESGLVSCENGAIRTEQSPNLYTGLFDETNLDLVWDDRAYAPQTDP